MILNAITTKFTLNREFQDSSPRIRFQGFVFQGFVFQGFVSKDSFPRIRLQGLIFEADSQITPGRAGVKVASAAAVAHRGGGGAGARRFRALLAPDGRKATSSSSAAGLKTCRHAACSMSTFQGISVPFESKLSCGNPLVARRSLSSRHRHTKNQRRTRPAPTGSQARVSRVLRLSAADDWLRFRQRHAGGHNQPAE